MIDCYNFSVSGRALQCRFDINSKVTLVQGDSGTGKTLLINIIYGCACAKECNETHSIEDGYSNVVDCDVAYGAFVQEPSHGWKLCLNEYNNAVIFIDGDKCYFAKTKEFAEYVRDSNNYYVIATREYLRYMEPSICEVCELVSTVRVVDGKKVFEYELNKLGQHWDSMV